MSRVKFLTGSIKLDLQSFGLNIISKNEYLMKMFPYLAKKQVIYDFDTYNKTISYKNFINELQNYCCCYDCEIEIVTLWETENEAEIQEFNVNPQIIKIEQFDDSKKYELIYKLENDCLNPSTSYLLKKE